MPNIHGLRAGKCIFGAMIAERSGPRGCTLQQHPQGCGWTARISGCKHAFVMRCLLVIQFFCFVSCERATYSLPLSSVRNWKEFLESCWWNSKPLDTKLMDRSYTTTDILMGWILRLGILKYFEDHFELLLVCVGWVLINRAAYLL